MTAPAFAPDFIRDATRESLVRDAIRNAVRPQLSIVASTPAERPRLLFREFVDRVNPRYRWYAHCIRAAAVLQRVADGELKRLLMLWPPRHGKTELVSKLFPAYLLYLFPERANAIAAYGASLSNKISRASRDYATTGGVAIREDASAVSEWETTQGGGVWSTGVGGPATGKGFYCGILDDPVKDAKDAHSALLAERLQDWWISVWLSRQEPEAALIVATTRWPGPGDFIGWLFDQESAVEYPERWHVMVLEAKKTADKHDLPSTCTLEPDPRAVGEALCPERYPIDRIRQIESRGAYFFQSLYQQRRSNREGRMFKWNWWQELKDTPVCTRYVRYWDLAGTEPRRKGHDPDYTASTLAGRMANLATCFIDSVAFRESIGKRDAKMEEIADADRKKYGARITWWLEAETGIGGKDRTDAIVRRLQAKGITVRTEPATGSKMLRAEPLAAAAEAGNVFLAAENGHRWHNQFRAHMAEFGPTCEHDDIADSASGAFNKITGSQSAVGFSSMDM